MIYHLLFTEKQKVIRFVAEQSQLSSHINKGSLIFSSKYTITFSIVYWNNNAFLLVATEIRVSFTNMHLSMKAQQKN